MNTTTVIMLVKLVFNVASLHHRSVLTVMLVSVDRHAWPVHCDVTQGCVLSRQVPASSC